MICSAIRAGTIVAEGSRSLASATASSPRIASAAVMRPASPGCATDATRTGAAPSRRAAKSRSASAVTLASDLTFSVMAEARPSVNGF